MKAPPANSAPTCTNCGAPLTGLFCVACGQDTRRGRLGVVELAATWLGVIVSFESRLAQTMIGLTIRPGQTAREYVEGRRVRYTNPLKYVLSTCAIWWGVLALYRSTLEETSNVLPAWVDYGQWINLGLLPALAIPMPLIFWGSRRNYAEELALVLFVSGHVFLMRAFMALMNFFPIPVEWLGKWLDPIAFTVWLTWSAWAFHRGLVRFVLLRAILATAAFIWMSVLTLRFVAWLLG